MTRPPTLGGIGRNAGHILEKGRHFISERRYGRKDNSLAYAEAGARAISYGGRIAVCLACNITDSRRRKEIVNHATRAKMTVGREPAWVEQARSISSGHKRCRQRNKVHSEYTIYRI
jgi:hypothetical protein